MKEDGEREMITINWKLSIGYPQAIVRGSFEIEVDASEEAIQEAIEEEAMEHVEYWRDDD